MNLHPNYHINETALKMLGREHSYMCIRIMVKSIAAIVISTLEYDAMVWSTHEKKM